MSNEQAQDKAMAMAETCITAINTYNTGAQFKKEVDLVLKTIPLARLLAAEAENAELKKRDGKWLDNWGACKICGGEILNGHTNDCDILKLELESRQLRAEVEQAKEAHRLQAANYAKLHDAIIGEGSSAGWPDPVEVAIELRARNALLEKVMGAARAGIGSYKSISDYIYGQYHDTQGDLLLNRWRVNMKDALTAYDQAEKGGGE